MTSSLVLQRLPAIIVLALLGALAAFFIGFGDTPVEGIMTFVGAAVILVGLFLRTDVLVVGLLFAIPFDRLIATTEYIQNLTASRLMAMALVIALTKDVLLRPSSFRLKTEVVVPLLMFLVAGLVAAYFSSRPTQGYTGLISTISYLSLFVACARVNGLSLERFIQLSLIPAVVLSVATIVSSLFFDRDYTVFTMLGKNTIGGLLGIYIPLCLGLIFYKSQHGNRFAYLVVALSLMAGALFLSDSKGGWVGVALAVIGFAVMAGMKRLALATFFLGLCTVAVLYFFETAGVRSVQFYSGESVPLLERLQIWQISWSLFIDHMLTGVGPSLFPNAYSDALQGHIFQYQRPTAHNILLHFAVELGVLGLLAFICLAGSLLLHAHRSWKMTSNYLVLGSLSAFIAHLIHNQVDCFIFEPAGNLMLWFSMSLLLMSVNCSSEGVNETRT